MVVGYHPAPGTGRGGFTKENHDEGGDDHDMTDLGTRPNCTALLAKLHTAMRDLDAWAETADALQDPEWAHRFSNATHELLGRSANWREASEAAKADYDEENQTSGDADNGQEEDQASRVRLIIRG